MDKKLKPYKNVKHRSLLSRRLTPETLRVTTVQSLAWILLECVYLRVCVCVQVRVRVQQKNGITATGL